MKKWLKKNPALSTTIVLLVLIAVKYPFLKFPVLVAIAVSFVCQKIIIKPYSPQNKALNKIVVSTKKTNPSQHISEPTPINFAHIDKSSFSKSVVLQKKYKPVNPKRISRINISALSTIPKPEISIHPNNLRAEQKQLLINYINAQEDFSEREIIIFRNYLSKRKNCIDAFCFLANAQRTFRIDRIQQCIDLETGELIENIPLFIENFFKLR